MHGTIDTTSFIDGNVGYDPNAGRKSGLSHGTCDNVATWSSE